MKPLTHALHISDEEDYQPPKSKEYRVFYADLSTTIEKRINELAKEGFVVDKFHVSTSYYHVIMVR